MQLREVEVGGERGDLLMVDVTGREREDELRGEREEVARRTRG